LVSHLLGIPLRVNSDISMTTGPLDSRSGVFVSGIGMKIAGFNARFDEELSPSFQGGSLGIMGLLGVSMRRGLIIRQ